MWFNNRGPISVSDEDFAGYQRIFAFPHDMSERFNILYQHWIDECYPDPIRRLALRDMLWQSADKLHDSDAYYYMTDASSFTQIFHLICPGKHHTKGQHGLTELLRDRPKLLDELVEEFLWLPSPEEKRKYHVRTRNSQCDAEIVEALLPLVDQETGQKLWQRHYASADDKRGVARLCLWERLADDPRWLSDQLRQRIHQDLAREVSQYSLLFLYRHTLSSVQERVSRNELTLLSAATRVLLSYQHDTDQKNLRHFVELARIMNDSVSETFRYLDFITLCKVMPELSNTQLMLDICRRHLTGICQDDPAYLTSATALAARQFLCWLYGTAAVFSDDVAFLHAVHECILRTYEHTSEFAKDQRPIAQSEQPSTY